MTAARARCAGRRRPDPLGRARALAGDRRGGPPRSRRPGASRADWPRRCTASRLFRMLLPRSVGGDEVQPATYLLAIEEIARHDASVAWNLFVANSALLIAAYLEPEVARDDLRRPAHRARLGASERDASRRRWRAAIASPAGWISPAAAGMANWMGVHCRVREADGSLRLNQLGRPVIRTLLFPAEQAPADRQLEPDRAARHRVRQLHGRGSVHARSLQHHARGPDAAPRAGAALCLHPAGPLCRGRGRRGAGHRAGDARRVHRARHRKTPRGLSLPGRQCGGAGRDGAREGQAGRGAGLSARHAG